MRKILFFLLIVFSIGLFWGSSVTVQSPEAGRLPVMTVAAVPAGEQDGIAYGGDLVVSSGESGLYSGYNANPIGHYFLPIHRSASDPKTLFDAKRYDYEDAGQAIGCQSTHWRSGLDTRPEAVIVRLNDGNPNTRDAGRRLLI